MEIHGIRPAIASDVFVMAMLVWLERRPTSESLVCALGKIYGSSICVIKIELKKVKLQKFFVKN